MTVPGPLQIVERRLSWPPRAPETPSFAREWLVTNGLGGYASGTVQGWLTRRFHGLLVASLPSPLGRMLLLSRVAERLVISLDGRQRDFTFGEPDGRASASAVPLVEFSLEWGLPVWRYENEAVRIERRVWMPYGQNTTHVEYTLIAAPGPARLVVRPFVQFRHHEGALADEPGVPYALTAVEGRFEICASPDHPTLRMCVDGAPSRFVVDPSVLGPVEYAIEHDRGYDATGSLHSVGEFDIALTANHPVAMLASSEAWHTVRAMSSADSHAAEIERRQRLVMQAPEPARKGVAAELVLAADQFLVLPAGRAEDHARARALGDEARTVIAGYPWFTDWGRDTMISLEGLTLLTGRAAEAGTILRTFAHYVRDGLLPNLFPEGEREGLYHTADATLWMFHALDSYVRTSGDVTTLERLLPTMLDIVDHHIRGTRFAIGVDPVDQLLRQGAQGYQLTWMDAKVGDWVVTPRRGKAVEINALWFNALRVTARWLEEHGRGDEARPYVDRADAVARSFNKRFWNAKGGYLFDLVDGEDGDDAACRPNQIFAVALPHPVLDKRHWPAVVDVVADRLLTPVGLRTLAPAHPDYRARYDGDLRSRDAAYHQGTAWAWLAGPFVDAWLRVHPDDLPGAGRVLEGLFAHLGEACVGTVSEIFDAEMPYHARGCIAQAWSVAEMLRACVRLAQFDAPAETQTGVGTAGTP